MLLVSCSQSVKPIYPTEGKIIFIEDVDGRDGLLAGNFGDIKVIDFDKERTQRLTHDSFYDANPSWSENGRHIYFESKRDPEKIGHGLAKGSDLYKLDGESGQITNFGDLLREKFSSQIGSRIREPSMSSDGKKLAFITNPNHEQRLVVVDMDSDTLLTLKISYDLFGLKNIRWSAKNNFLSFEYKPEGGVVKAIAFYDLTREIGQTISKQVMGGPLYGKGALTCSAGSWINDMEVIFSCRKLGVFESTIYKYDLQKNKETELFNVKGLNIVTPQINNQQNKILYIASNKENDYDIWLYDFKADSTTQITFDSHEKKWLSWYQ